MGRIPETKNFEGPIEIPIDFWSNEKAYEQIFQLGTLHLDIILVCKHINGWKSRIFIKYREKDCKTPFNKKDARFYAVGENT